MKDHIADVCAVKDFASVGPDDVNTLAAAIQALERQRVPEGWTERHSRVLDFALRRFIWQAHDRAVDAGQQREDPQAAEKVKAFLADAETARECLEMLAAAPEPDSHLDPLTGALKHGA